MRVNDIREAADPKPGYQHAKHDPPSSPRWIPSANDFGSQCPLMRGEIWQDIDQARGTCRCERDARILQVNDLSARRLAVGTRPL